MEYLVITLLIIVIVILLLTIFRNRRNDWQGLALRMAARERSNFRVLKPCPLCRAMLQKGETVRSRLIEVAGGTRRSSQVVERRAELMGCPYCWPPNPEHPRICPVCHQALGDQDLVKGRYFERDTRKDHLRILGCSRCHP